MGHEEQVTERADLLEVEDPTSGAQINWVKPFEFLSLQPRTALVVLNQAIRSLDLQKVWTNTELHVCADGGANRLFDYFDDEAARALHIPNFVVGDFDSLREDVKEYYQQRGAVILEQNSQYSSDLMKASLVVQLYFHSDSSRKALAGDIDSVNGVAELAEGIDLTNDTQTIRAYYLGGIGGRFDQTVHSISQMYAMNESAPNVQQFFITYDDVIFLVKKGKNFVSYGNKSRFFRGPLPCCGLLPLGNKPVVLNTYGLKYDVKNWESSVGGKVSSSNSVSGVSGFYVESTDDLIINIEIDHQALW